MSTATMTVTIPASNLVQLVESVIGERSAIVTIETATVVKLNKTHRETKAKCPFVDGVLRRATRNVILGSNYENVLNGRREKAGEVADFQAESMWGGKGKRLNRHFIYHATTGKVYLAYLPKTDDENVVKNIDSEYVDIKTGRVLASSEVTPYLPPYRENELEWRVVEVGNVKAIKYAGNRYTFNHSVTIENVADENPTVVEV